MKIFFLFISFMLTFSSLIAQDYQTDAGRMMRYDLNGTARSLAVGGALSSVGLDMASMASNPAGIGLYQNHEITVSGGAALSNTNSTYINSNSEQILGKSLASLKKPSFSQVGIIFAGRKMSNRTTLKSFGRGSLLSRIVIGINYQKLADFNRKDNFSGINTMNSRASAAAATLNQNPGSIDLNNFDIKDVSDYEAKIFEDTGGTDHRLKPRIGLPVNQSAVVTTQGSINELDVTIGFSIANTMYIGVGAGIPHMSYSRSISFYEGDVTGNNNYTSNYDYSYKGWGVNGKLGLIIKPAKWIRIGAAIQSPTAYHLHESIKGAVTSNFNDSSSLVSNSASYKLSYNNPLKGTFGVSLYIKQWMMLSMDYVMDDYGHTRFLSGLRENVNTINNSISTGYRLSSTFRGGIEISYKKLRLRGGFSWAQSPFKDLATSSTHDTGARFNYTAGIGLAGSRFFADIAYVRTQYKDYYAPYSYQNGSSEERPGVYNSFVANTIIATIGLKFGKTTTP